MCLLASAPFVPKLSLKWRNKRTAKKRMLLCRILIWNCSLKLNFIFADSALIYLLKNNQMTFLLECRWPFQAQVIFGSGPKNVKR